MKSVTHIQSNFNSHLQLTPEKYILLFSSSGKVLRCDWTHFYLKGAHFIRAYGVGNACLLVLAAQVSVVVLPHATSSGGSSSFTRTVSGTDAGGTSHFFISHLLGCLGIITFSSVSFPVTGILGGYLLQSRFVTWIGLFPWSFSVISCPSLWLWGIHEGVTALFQMVNIKTLAPCIRVAIAGSLCLFLSLIPLSGQAKPCVFCRVLCWAMLLHEQIGNWEAACPCPGPALQISGLRPRLLGHADITAETPIPWPQKLCFRASILPLCTQFTALYSSFGSFSCSGAQGILDASLSPNCHCAVLVVLSILASCGFSAILFFLPLNVVVFSFFVFWIVESERWRNVHEINISLGTSKLPVSWALKLNMAYLVVRPTWKCYLQ